MPRYVLTHSHAPEECRIAIAAWKAFTSPWVATPTVWCHSTVVTVLTDAASETLEFEQEVIEILAMEGDAVQAQAAAVIRIPGLGLCLGRFQPPS